MSPIPSQQAAWQPAGKDAAEAVAENSQLIHKSEAERTRLNQGVFFFFFETSKPTDTPPPTRPLLLILPKQSITESQTFKCTNLGGGNSQSNRYGGAVGRGGTAWLGEHNTRAGFQFVIKNVISQLPVFTPMLVVCCHIAILPCRLSLGP